MRLFRRQDGGPPAPLPPGGAPPGPFTGHMFRYVTADDARRIEIAVHMITCVPPTDRALLGWHGWDGGEAG